jgi:hypothetical protein
MAAAPVVPPVGARVRNFHNRPPHHMGCRHANGRYVGSDLRYLLIIVVAHINGQLV